MKWFLLLNLSIIRILCFLTAQQKTKTLGRTEGSQKEDLLSFLTELSIIALKHDFIKKWPSVSGFQTLISYLPRDVNVIKHTNQYSKIRNFNNYKISLKRKFYQANPPAKIIFSKKNRLPLTRQFIVLLDTHHPSLFNVHLQTSIFLHKPWPGEYTLHNHFPNDAILTLPIDQIPNPPWANGLQTSSHLTKWYVLF